MKKLAVFILVLFIFLFMDCTAEANCIFDLAIISSSDNESIQLDVRSVSEYMNNKVVVDSSDGNIFVASKNDVTLVRYRYGGF